MRFPIENHRGVSHLHTRWIFCSSIQVPLIFFFFCSFIHFSNFPSVTYAYLSHGCPTVFLALSRTLNPLLVSFVYPPIFFPSLSDTSYLINPYLFRIMRLFNLIYNIYSGIATLILNIETYWRLSKNFDLVSETHNFPRLFLIFQHERSLLPPFSISTFSIVSTRCLSPNNIPTREITHPFLPFVWLIH